MFESLGDRLQNAINKIKGYGKISEENMELIKLSVSDKGHAYDDNVSYFYNEFIYNSQDNYGVKFYSEKEAHEYVQNVYKDAFGSQNSNKFFVFDLKPTKFSDSRLYKNIVLGFEHIKPLDSVLYKFIVFGFTGLPVHWTHAFQFIFLNLQVEFPS